MTSPLQADTTDRKLLADFRARVVRIGLVASWAILAVIVVHSIRLEVIADPRVWGPALGAVLGLVALSFVPWREVLERPPGDALLLLWSILTVLALSVASSVPGLGEAVFFLYFIVLAFSAAVLPLLLHGLVAALVLLGRSAASAMPGASPGPEALVLEILSLVVVALLTGMVAEEFRREARASYGRLTEIRRREADLERLYELSRTVVAGESLAEVLPSLVGKITGHLRARVGVVLLYRPEGSVLQVVSPIWRDGRPVAVNPYHLPLTRGGTLERVFLERRPAVSNRLLADGDLRDGLLEDLGVDRMMAVPLQVENRTIGVLMVGDRLGETFGDEDLRALSSLAAPAALVLDQLARREEAETASRRMGELARLKTDFVSVVSHELRTPLTSIIGSLATLARHELDPSTPRGRELLASARKQAERLRMLIEDLLMVSRIDARALPQHPEPLRLEEFVPETVRSVPGADARVRVEVGEGLLLEADPDHLRRIITNLVENALKYAPGSPVDVRAAQEEDEVLISVADQGPGIPEGDRERVFERFSQLAPAHTRERGGTGLGLSIVRSLTEAMGGRVWLEETEGGGATFVVALPRSPGAIRLRTRR